MIYYKEIGSLKRHPINKLGNKMSLRAIYILSLEYPGPGFNYFNNLHELNTYALGYLDSAEFYGNNDASDEWIEFREWLRTKGYLPCKGWPQKIIDESENTKESFQLFIELLYEYIKIKIPKWFIEFNKKEQESRWKNVNGPRSSDIRNIEHINWVKNA